MVNTLRPPIRIPFFTLWRALSRFCAFSIFIISTLYPYIRPGDPHRFWQVLPVTSLQCLLHLMASCPFQVGNHVAVMVIIAAMFALFTVAHLQFHSGILVPTWEIMGRLISRPVCLSCRDVSPPAQFCAPALDLFFRWLLSVHAHVQVDALLKAGFSGLRFRFHFYSWVALVRV